jgi:mRNA interferase MazF
MSYEKDHDGWNNFIKNRMIIAEPPFFKKREVWWVSIGVNVGHEEDGKGDHYSRPVLILKKFGMHTFLGLPLSTTSKTGELYYPFVFLGQPSTALLGHLRSFDSMRLLKKYGTVDEITFQSIRKAAKEIL